jgi:tetratricopeptide (TPR) repeat protein
MRNMVYLVIGLLMVIASCNHKPKKVQGKENVVPDSVRIKESREALDNYMESLLNAQMKFVKKDYTGAIVEYTKLIESSSSMRGGSEEFIARGVAKDSLKDYKGAIDDYTKAIEKSPGNTRPYIKRGLSRRSLKDYKGAIDDFTKCLEFDPNNLWIYYNRGLVRIESGDKNGGCEDLQKVAGRNSSIANEAIKKYCQ